MKLVEDHKVRFKCMNGCSREHSAQLSDNAAG